MSPLFLIIFNKLACLRDLASYSFDKREFLEPWHLNNGGLLHPADFQSLNETVIGRTATCLNHSDPGDLGLLEGSSDSS